MWGPSFEQEAARAGQAAGPGEQRVFLRKDGTGFLGSARFRRWAATGWALSPQQLSAPAARGGDHRGHTP